MMKIKAGFLLLWFSENGYRKSTSNSQVKKWNDIYFLRWNNHMADDELVRLAGKADAILKEELEKESLPYESAEVRIYDIKTVGVQGDARTYWYPAEITLYSGEGFVWSPEFIGRVSTRMTNETEGINRVVYTIAHRQKQAYSDRPFL